MKSIKEAAYSNAGEKGTNGQSHRSRLHRLQVRKEVEIAISDYQKVLGRKTHQSDWTWYTPRAYQGLEHVRLIERFLIALESHPAIEYILRTTDVENALFGVDALILGVEEDLLVPLTFDWSMSEGSYRPTDTIIKASSIGVLMYGYELPNDAHASVDAYTAFEQYRRLTEALQEGDYMHWNDAPTDAELLGIAEGGLFNTDGESE